MKISKKNSNFYSTIDLDECGRKTVEKIIREIKRCRNLVSISYKKSPSKRGYHIRLYCKELCFLCRIKFDDIFRLNADLVNRPLDEQNVLFSKKEHIILHKTQRLSKAS